MERAGFEPAYSKRADLQSAAINHSATSPLGGTRNYAVSRHASQLTELRYLSRQRLIRVISFFVKSSAIRG